jgi:hypothetical protein
MKESKMARWKLMATEFKDVVPTEDALVVSRLKGAGAVVMLSHPLIF